MNSDKPVYYNNILLQCSDTLISSQIFKVDQFFSSDNWGMSTLKIKISISNYKSKSSEQMVLDFQTIYQYLEKCKTFIESFKKNIQEIEKNTTKQETFFITGKKKFFITLLYRTEYGGPCFRFIISDKNDSFLDSEKVYVSINDFLSFTKLLSLFRDSYILLSSNSNILISLSDISNKLETLNEKVTAYSSEYFSKNNSTEKFAATSIEENKYITPGVHAVKEINLSEISNINNLFDITENNTKKEDGIQEILDNYIKEEVPKIKLDVSESFEIEKKDPSISMVSKSFTQDLLDNNLSKFESLIINLANNDLPFSKACEYIESKLNFNILKDFNSNDLNSLNYLISCYLKYQLKTNIEKKQKLPQSISPIIIDNIQIDDQKLSIVYDLFLYMIYLTQTRNFLQDKNFNSVKNKELFSFILKMIFSPIVFSCIYKCDIAPLVSEIGRRYSDYKEKGVFDLFEKQIYTEFSSVPNITSKIIEEEVSKILNILKQNIDKCNIKSSFEKYQKINVIKLTYDDINKNNFSLEQIKKIISLELNYYKNSMIVFDDIQIKDFSDISQDILKKYGVSDIKYDNTNLERFVSESCKDNKENLDYCISLIKKIKESYFDLKNEEIDFSKIPENVLKAIYLWNLKEDKKISINYIYYCDLINKSSLERDSLISILSNIDEKQNEDFVGAFQSSIEEK